MSSPTLHDIAPDPPMSPEQASVAASLTLELIERIDTELLSHARRSSRKVAMLVGMAMGNEAVRVPGLPDVFYAQRVRILVEKRLLIGEGNLSFMRHSEVRLP